MEVKMENDMKILIALICLFCFLSGSALLIMMNSKSEISQNDLISEADVQRIMASEFAKNKVEIPEQKLDLTEFNAKIADMQIVIDSIVDEDKISEAKAEELALEEVSMSRSFRRLIVDVLNYEEENVEDYRDIGEIYNIEVEEVNNMGEEVIIEFKVRYYNDGDDEEEDLQKAKLSVTFVVEGLDYDDSYEDAEVTSESFEVLKIYE